MILAYNLKVIKYPVTLLKWFSSPFMWKNFLKGYNHKMKNRIRMILKTAAF